MTWTQKEKSVTRRRFKRAKKKCMHMMYSKTWWLRQKWSHCDFEIDDGRWLGRFKRGYLLYTFCRIYDRKLHYKLFKNYAFQKYILCEIKTIFNRCVCLLRIIKKTLILDFGYIKSLHWFKDQN